MEQFKPTSNRRNFLKASSMISVGMLLPTITLAQTTTFSEGNIHQFGKREGYTDQISILISMMDWMRATVLRSVDGISQKELDFLLDEKSNSIGAMLMHLAATERYYQIHTFDYKEWGDFDKKDTDVWDVGSQLGDRARKELKGKPLSFYTNHLSEIRNNTKTMLKTKDDSWLMEETKFFGGQPTNNYCKWFHVVEHESNHNGQIKLIKSRVV